MNSVAFEQTAQNIYYRISAMEFSFDSLFVGGEVRTVIIRKKFKTVPVTG
jgi:hypothetical protein